MQNLPEKIVEVVNPDALSEADLIVETEQTRDGELFFDPDSDIPFFVRYEIDGGVDFFNMEGVLSEPEARQTAHKNGFNIVNRFINRIRPRDIG